MHHRPTSPPDALVAPPALLHEASVANAEVRPRADPIFAPIRAMGHAPVARRTRRVCHVALLARALIGARALPVQAGLAAVGFAGGPRGVGGPSWLAGALVGGGADAVLAASGAGGHAGLVLEQVALLAGALVGADAGAPGAAALAEVLAFAGSLVFYEAGENKGMNVVKGVSNGGTVHALNLAPWLYFTANCSRSIISLTVKISMRLK